MLEEYTIVRSIRLFTLLFAILFVSILTTLSCQSDKSKQPFLGSKYDLLSDEENILSFENADLWNGIETVNTIHTHGDVSGEVVINGWTQITSSAVSVDGEIGNILTLDLWCPTSVGWGTIDVIFNSNSASIYSRSLGTQSLTQLNVGAFNHIEFSVPNDIQDNLTLGVNDLFISITINTEASNEPYLIDNISFNSASTSSSCADSSAVETFTFSIPDSIAINQSAVVASESLRIANSTNLKGYYANVMCAGSGETLIEGQSVLDANVYTEGPLTLNSGSIVRRDAFSESTIFLQAEASVEGTEYPNTSIDWKEYSWKVSFPYSDVDYKLEGNGDELIPPGAYDELSVKEGGQVTLAAGSYYFNSIQLEPGSILNINGNGEPVVVYVRNHLETRATIVHSTNASDFFIGYTGDSMANLDAPFSGTVVAPNAVVRLAPLTNTAYHEGAFIGKRVEIEPTTTVKFRPFKIENWNTAIFCNSSSRDEQRYLFCSMPKTYSDAEAFCKNQGMHLATIDDELENQFIGENAIQDSFIGLNDLEQNGSWEWLSNHAVAWCGDENGNAPNDQYSNWSENMLSGGHCGSIEQCEGAWNSLSCEEKNPFVCESLPTHTDTIYDYAEQVIDDFRSGRPIIRNVTLKSDADIQAPFVKFARDFGLRACVDALAEIPESMKQIGTETERTSYQQYYKNIPVHGGFYTVDRRSADGSVTAIAGYFNHKIDIEIEPAISETDAINYAIAAMSKDVVASRNDGLSIMKTGKETWHLVWNILLDTTSDEQERFYISATTGDVISKSSSIVSACSNGVETNDINGDVLEFQSTNTTQQSDPTSLIVSSDSATDDYVLFSRGFNASSNSPSTELPIMFVNCPPGEAGAFTMVEGSNLEVDETDSVEEHGALVLQAAQRCIEFLDNPSDNELLLNGPGGGYPFDYGYDNHQGWKGFDELGQEPISLVIESQNQIACSFGCYHEITRQIEFAGAYFDIQGATEFMGAPMESVCHEFFHGIAHEVLFGGELEASPSGKEGLEIGEGLADIFGNTVEMYHRGFDSPGGTCFIGDRAGNSECLRDFANPENSTTPSCVITDPPDPSAPNVPGAVIYPYCPRDYMGPNYNYTSSDRCENGSTVDCWSEHRNSTVLSHWFYLLTRGSDNVNESACPYFVEPLDSDPEVAVYKAWKIIFSALSMVAWPDDSLNFSTFATQTIASGYVLYGLDSVESQIIADAWNAVNVIERVNTQEFPEHIYPARGSVNILPWTRFTWPAMGDEEAWDFQMTYDSPFDGGTIIFEKYGITDHTVVSEGEASELVVGQMDLALPPMDTGRFYWRVRPAVANGANEPWKNCYPIHSFIGTGDLSYDYSNFRVNRKSNPDENDLVIPGSIEGAWDKDIYLAELTAGHEYKVARIGGSCENVPADLLDAEGFSFPDYDLEYLHPSIFADPIYPENEYEIYLIAHGPENWVQNTELYSRAPCVTKEFETSELPPPDLDYPHDGDIFDITDQHPEYLAGWYYTDTDERELLHWRVDSWVDDFDDMIAVINFYEINSQGNCEETIVGTYEVAGENGDYYFNEDIFPTETLNMYGYCWDASLRLEFGENIYTSELSEKQSFTYSFPPVDLLYPGVNLVHTYWHNLAYGAQAIAWDATGVSFSWNPVPRATNYQFTLAEHNPEIGIWIPWQEEALALQFNTGGTSAVITGDIAARGRYKWSVKPLFEDADLPFYDYDWQNTYTTSHAPFEFIETSAPFDGEQYEPLEVISGTMFTEFAPLKSLTVGHSGQAEFIIDASSCGVANYSEDDNDPPFDFHDCLVDYQISGFEGGETIQLIAHRYYPNTPAEMWDPAVKLQDVVKEYVIKECGSRYHGDPCCNIGDSCLDSWVFCDRNYHEEGRCESCGAPDTPCCPEDAFGATGPCRPDEGVFCNDENFCEAYCGYDGLPCCPIEVTGENSDGCRYGGEECHNGMCFSCGGDGEYCCEDESPDCYSGLECTDGRCRPECGQFAGDECCDDGDEPCIGDLVCSSGTCREPALYDHLYISDSNGGSMACQSLEYTITNGSDTASPSFYVIAAACAAAYTGGEYGTCMPYALHWQCNSIPGKATITTDDCTALTPSGWTPNQYLVYVTTVISETDREVGFFEEGSDGYDAPDGAIHQFNDYCMGSDATAVQCSQTRACYY